MAVTKALTTRDAVDHPKAYIVPVQINFSPRDKTGQVTFYVYHSKAAANAGAAPIGYPVTIPLPASLIQRMGAKFNGVVQLAYDIAKDTGDDIPQEVKDFFAGTADDV